MLCYILYNLQFSKLQIYNQVNMYTLQYIKLNIYNQVNTYTLQ